MRKALRFTALLALFALLALPLAAADVTAADAPIAEAADAGAAPIAAEPAPEAAPEVGTDDLEALFDNGQVEQTCYYAKCNRDCQLTHGVPGDCLGGRCVCAL